MTSLLHFFVGALFSAFVIGCCSIGCGLIIYALTMRMTRGEPADRGQLVGLLTIAGAGLGIVVGLVLVGVNYLALADRWW